MLDRRHLLDPDLHDLSPRHLEVYWRYQVVRTGVDFGAALCFVVGSVLFFWERTTFAATWLFLVGSLLFAVKPTIDMVRAAHLRRLPAWDNSSSDGTPEERRQRSGARSRHSAQNGTRVSSRPSPEPRPDRIRQNSTASSVYAGAGGVSSGLPSTDSTVPSEPNA